MICIVHKSESYLVAYLMTFRIFSVVSSKRIIFKKCFRYLYVNSRPWPCGYRIKSPLDPPPIAQEIDIHVIDLVTLQEVGTMLRAHKAYTPNNECFFIFLDVCNEYVAR